MGHMDDVLGDPAEKFTITVYVGTAHEVFNGCTEVDQDYDGGVEFTDKNGLKHQFHGVTFHVVEEK